MDMNLLDDAGWMSEDISGRLDSARPGFDRRRKRIAGDHLGASLYSLPPGQATFPYHYELGNDELLVVVMGRPTLRSADGMRELKPGDCIHFPSGEAGAHQVINRSDGEARVLLVSSFANMPRAAVQPDSGKMLVRWSVEPDAHAWFRLDSATDYWDGERPPADEL
jgi:uncharacterized cupin superfamily protein